MALQLRIAKILEFERYHPVTSATARTIQARNHEPEIFTLVETAGKSLNSVRKHFAARPLCGSV